MCESDTENFLGDKCVIVTPSPIPPSPPTADTRLHSLAFSQQEIQGNSISLGTIVSII